MADKTAESLRSVEVMRRLGKVTGALSTYVFAPVSIVMDLDQAAQALLDGDTRTATGASISAFGGFAGLTIALIGGLTGVGIIVGLGFVATGLFVSWFMDSQRKVNLLIWAEYNYFGKSYTEQLSSQINTRPVDPRFEWNHPTRERIIQQQLRSLTSLLRPAKVDYSNVFFDDGEYHELEITVESLPISPSKHLVKFRFFDDNGREQDHHDYRLPLHYDDPERGTNAAWKSDPEHIWFKSHELEYNDANDPRKGVKKYTIIFRLPLISYLTYRYTQIQFIPIPQGYDYTQPVPSVEQEQINNNPFILTYTKRVRVQ